MHDGMLQETLRVDENMPLLARIIAMQIDIGPLFQRFSRSGRR